MTITHYDLFAGIGGFSLSLEEVFNDATIRHIFCEWESFPTAVLRRHWPQGLFYGDIAELVTDSECQGRERCSGKDKGRCRQLSGEIQNQEQGFSIVTGGFPCQPFSAAGRRKGTADDRYQWPNMYAVIRNTKPDWVIAENVRGLVTWSDGLVLETVCADLEAEGYEVQPFIIPAVAVGAPHRRDRVWIIAHAKHNRPRGEKREVTTTPDRVSEVDRAQHSTAGEFERADSDGQAVRSDADTGRKRWEPGSSESVRSESQEPRTPNRQYPDWQRNWQEVAFATCDDAVDDGLSRLVDGVPYSRAKWRKDSLKAYGNGIVHQVATQIIKGIKESI